VLPFAWTTRTRQFFPTISVAGAGPTSDAELARRVRAHGGEVVGGRRLLDQL
jgi:hypothetical protein